jgi:hypothetical protein
MPKGGGRIGRKRGRGGSSMGGGGREERRTESSPMISKSLFGKKKSVSCSAYQEHLETVSNGIKVVGTLARDVEDAKGTATTTTTSVVENATMVSPEFDDEVVGKINWEDALDHLSDEEEEACLHRDNRLWVDEFNGGRGKRTKSDIKTAERIAKGRKTPASKLDVERYRGHLRDGAWDIGPEEEQKIRRDMEEVRRSRTRRVKIGFAFGEKKEEVAKSADEESVIYF